MRLLIVEDEQKLADVLKESFEKKGFAVDHLADGTQARNRIVLYQKDYDLVLLDLNIPGMDGAEITESVRAENVTTPIIILTAHSETEHKIDLLNKGADDYVVKPFSFDELLARVTSVLRRPVVSNPIVLKAGPLEMDTAKRMVTRDGETVPLTLKEFALLEHFMRDPEKVLKREDLIDHVWDFNAFPLSNVLDVHMKNLRKKLNDKEGDENPKLLQTIRGVGYRLVGGEE